MSRPRLLIALAAALLLVPAAPAAATTVDVLGGGLEVKAGPGERNELRVTLGTGIYSVTEAAPFTTLQAGFGCTQAGPARVTCSAGGIGRVFVETGDGADTLTFDADVAATIDDGPGDDVVHGGPRGDVLIGAPGDDVLWGRGGDDQFGDAGGEGADAIDGGAGRDTADYSGRAAGVTASLDGAPGDGAAGEGDDIEATVEELRGGSGNDRLRGGDAANVLRGNAGDDVLDGRGGADRLEGGSGRDTADYGARAGGLTVTLDGAANDAGEADNVTGDVENVRGGAGDDTLIGSGGQNRLEGGRGADELHGGGDADALSGGDGDDALLGGTGDDDLHGGGGTDDFDGGDGGDAVDYRDRSEALVVDTSTGRGAGGEQLTAVEGVLGGSGNDRLSGGGGNGRFDGGPGDDVLDGGHGADRLIGGAGRDRVSYASRDEAVGVWLDEGGGDGASGERDDVRGDVEEVVGGRGDDRLGGDADAEVLLGGSGDDRIAGGGGDDLLEGSSGHDQLEGGTGADRLSGAAGNDRLYAHDGDDVLDGGAGGDVLDGQAGADRLAGGDGDDRLNGQHGDDRLSGDDGADRAYGDDGDDAVEGGSGDDQLGGGRGNDAVHGSGGDDKAYGEDGDDGVHGGDGNDSIGGGNGDDGVDGGEGDDKAEGGDGADGVAGGGGRDEVGGGSGPDRLDGGNGDDRLNAGDGDDALDGGPGNDRLGASHGADVLAAGPGDDKLYGENGPDRLDGGDGGDETSGGDGDDVLAGGAGPDRIEGGRGEDTVDYATRGAGVRVTNDGKADDGEPGERDDVRESVDHAIGGAGNDVLRLRSDWPHRLYGEGGDDVLDGGPKADELVGGPGRDQLLGRGGRDLFDGGEGDDRLSGADALAEQLRCGAGRDVAVRDRIDKGVGCETLKIGKPSVDDGRGGDAEESAPLSDDLVPVSSSPGTRTGVKRVTSRGRFVAIPGSPGARIDSRLLRDVAYLKARYRIAVASGFALRGHARDGEHPVGLALDVVPGPGGSWADVDRLAKWAEPRQNRPRAPFRRVGYDGDSGHGRGHHLHLSWNHGRSRRGRPVPWVDTFAFKGDRAVKAPSVRVLTALASRSNFRLGGKPTVASGLKPVKRCGGPAQLWPTWRAAAKAFGLRASVLAAITEIESGHGCAMGPSSAGAIGWTQFMPGTWKMWGMDADGDRKASPYSSVDAIFSTARYLRASGAPRDYRRALFAYNHATWYVNKVLARSKAYRQP